MEYLQHKTIKFRLKCTENKCIKTGYLKYQKT